MRYRKLGRTGFEVSEIGFGAWAIGGGWGPQDEKRRSTRCIVRLTWASTSLIQRQLAAGTL